MNILTYAQVKTATATLVEWWLSGAERVEDTEIVRRSLKCVSGGPGGQTCQYNRPPDDCDCSGKFSVTGLLEKIVGGKWSKWDGCLYSCKLCGCDLKAKVRLPLAVLKKHEKEGIQYPEYCWLA